MPKYKTVVIDPPWPLNGSKLELPHGSFPQVPYNTMSLNEIKSFPIDDFAAEESLLFLWVITRSIRFGFDILEEWGFKFHQIITWDKGSGHAIWSPLMGRTEHCLFAYRGNFRVLVNRMGVMQNLIKSDKTRKHSQKPSKFYRLIREWTPEPRIDIFARRAHVGFDGWGFEYVGEGPLSKYIYAEEGPFEEWLE